jgi:hypothetical protein
MFSSIALRKPEGGGDALRRRRRDVEGGSMAKVNVGRLLMPVR